MPPERLDISDSFIWEEGLPRPQWDLLTAWVEARVAPDDRAAAWTDISRQWLEKLGPALGGDYHIGESDHFLLLTPLGEKAADQLLHFAERCRRDLLAAWPGVAAFRAEGKQVVLSLHDVETYYTYLSVFYPEGKYGGSGGAHVRDGRSQLVLHGPNNDRLAGPLAHELTHASLTHLSLPVWVEEGMTQQFERAAAGRPAFTVDSEEARRHKRFWKKHGLDLFWHGKGFHRPDKGQKLSYQLAEILHQLLVEEHRPRWFGLDKAPQRRFFAFLRGAKRSDGGAAAARTHLRRELGDLAARFLGPGDWSPGPPVDQDEALPPLAQPAGFSHANRP
jgi:hypothetical protein